MPGDNWQKLANIRLLFLSMFTHPGQKLMFMGCEFGQTSEWNVNNSLHWELLSHPAHQGVRAWIQALNKTYQKEEALYALNYSPEGYEWIDFGDSQNTVLSLIRKSRDEYVIVVLNFSPVVRGNYRIGVPENAKYKEILNSDHADYGGSNVCNTTILKAEKIASHGRTYSISLILPPLGGIILKSRKK
jgi:1,4-alpha-glucan branching enzyme